MEGGGQTRTPQAHRTNITHRLLTSTTQLYESTGTPSLRAQQRREAVDTGCVRCDKPSRRWACVGSVHQLPRLFRSLKLRRSAPSDLAVVTSVYSIAAPAQRRACCVLLAVQCSPLSRAATMDGVLASVLFD